MLNFDVDFRKIEFECSKCKVHAEACFVEGEFANLVCPSCSVRTTAARAIEMFFVELEYFRDKKLQDGMLGGLVSSGVQVIHKSAEELFRPEWEFRVVENDYLFHLVSSL